MPLLCLDADHKLLLATGSANNDSLYPELAPIPVLPKQKLDIKRMRFTTFVDERHDLRTAVSWRDLFTTAS
jgi:hypothetical protein